MTDEKLCWALNELTIIVGNGKTGKSNFTANCPAVIYFKDHTWVKLSSQLLVNWAVQATWSNWAFLCFWGCSKSHQTQAHIHNMNAAWCVMFSRVWLTWSSPQKIHRGSVWSQSFPCCGGLIGHSQRRAFPVSITADRTVPLPWRSDRPQRVGSETVKPKLTVGYWRGDVSILISFKRSATGKTLLPGLFVISDWFWFNHSS